MIFGALAALLGLAAVAQASGDDRSVMPPAGQVTQERTTDGRDSVHDRSERREHAREAGERHGDDREGRDEGRERERHDRD
jgi:hypothetical protein